MDFSQTVPCSHCPFRRDPQACRLTPGRAREIASNMLRPDGGTMPCHLTLKRRKADQIHCAGALIFAERHQVANQALRIAGRLGLYDPKAFATSPAMDEVFTGLDDMLAGHRARIPMEKS